MVSRHIDNFSYVLIWGPVVYQTTLHFTHFANTDYWQSDAKIVNLENYQENIQIHFYLANGEDIESFDLLLDPRMSTILEIPPFAASAMIEADGRLAGWTTFANVDGGSDIMPVVSQVSNTIVIPHIASSRIWWTGLAFANMNTQAATVTVDFDNHEQYQFSLPAHGQHAFFVGALAENIQGASSAVATSDRALSALIIYGKRPLGGEGADFAALSLGKSAKNLYVPAINENSDWTGIGIHNSDPSAVNLTCEVFDPNHFSTEHDLGFLAGGEHTAFKIHSALGASDGSVLVRGTSSQTLFDDIQIALDGIVLWGDGAHVGGYDLAGNGFSKGVINLLGLDDELYLFNPNESEVTVHYEAYASSGIKRMEGSLILGAEVNSVTRIADITDGNTDYLLFSAEQMVYGHLQNKSDQALKVLPVVGY